VGEGFVLRLGIHGLPAPFAPSYDAALRCAKDGVANESRKNEGREHEGQKTRARSDADGVTVAPVAGVRRGVWLIVLAMASVALAAVLALRLLLPRAEPTPPANTTAAAVAQAAQAPAPPARAASRRARPVRRSAPSPAPPPAEGEIPPEAPELPQLPEEPVAGPSGIALYPPMGSDPPKRGILVPEDFELPEGYVRHYQASDEGEGLPAILMFHPDYEWLDENGEPLPLPADRVVPPELAPDGMPIHLLELPASGSAPDAAP
jgi:hypothetical protein